MSPEKWKSARDRFLELRFARLCNFLRARAPDANIGYSILIYRLTAQEVNDATAGPALTGSTPSVRRAEGAEGP